MARRTPDREYIPPVQTLQIRYAKRGRMRFASHRDFQRAWERALRRVAVPMAYSAGFSPHPKVSYAGAAPTGAASEAEFLEIGVIQAVDPEQLRASLDDALPEGLDIVSVVEASVPLTETLRFSKWRLEWPSDVSDAVSAFESCASVGVERVTKAGRRTIDVRALCSDLRMTSPTTLELTVQHAEPTPRPAEVVAAIRQVAADVPPDTVLATRLAQGLSEDGEVRPPF
ncbi:MAG: TIGR03936 family radical SAM-associated protein [Candidatus Nanopelagicales bacterium]